LKTTLMPAVILCFFMTASMPATADQGRDLRMESRQVIRQFAGQLRSHLLEQMKRGGPPAAISVCSRIAPDVASRLSRKTGWRIRRVSLKIRNPLDLPDTWERKILHRFEEEASKGKPVRILEHAEIVREGNHRYFRYMKAIPAGKPCLICHGPKEGLSPQVKALLREKYPHDQATGYHAGMIRGAFSITRPLW